MKMFGVEEAVADRFGTHPTWPLGRELHVSVVGLGGENEELAFPHGGESLGEAFRKWTPFFGWLRVLVVWEVVVGHGRAPSLATVGMRAPLCRAWP